MLAKYVQQDDSLVISKNRVEDEKKELIAKTIPQMVQEGVKQEVEKLETMSRNEAMRYRLPYNINSNTNPDFKPMGSVPFSYLRRMANTYPIARACINRRIRQITQLEWDITTVDEKKDEKGFEAQIAEVKAFLKQPMGNKTRMREMLTIMVDDVLTIDATCFEMQKRRGGQFMYLIPVDPTTIALRVTETGGTPEPPDPAYAQFIDGHKIDEFSTDEMIYEVMGNRSYSPYGLAPLESLVLQVESAIRGALYNLNYFKENNVPEGFIMLPEDQLATKDQVQEYQIWFDALLSGDPKFNRRLKILPGGSEYIAAKKPEDMAFERFEMWLLQQTCAVFDVPPQDIGITYQVNKATSESQSDLSRERGLIPLGNFIKEIFDDIIQVEMGLADLQFIWRNINPVDRKEEVEIAEKEIKLGVLSGDEYRIDQGREPIGLRPFVDTPKGPLFVDDLVSGKVGAVADGKRADESAKAKAEAPVVAVNPAEEKQKAELVDLRRWKRCVYQDLEMNKPLRAEEFESTAISPEVRKAIIVGLKDVHSRFQAKTLFDLYIDPEIKASMTLLDYASQLRNMEHESTPA